MTKKAQKATERFFLDQFIEKTGRWKFARDGNPPEPDFFVSDSCGELGVELTSIQNDAAPGESSPAARDVSLRERFMRRAAEHYYASGGLPIAADAVTLPPEGLDLEDLTRRLKEARECALQRDEKVHEFEITPNDDRHERPFARLRVHALEGEKFARYSWWQSWENSSGWVLRAHHEHLQPVVSRKAANLANYKKSTSRVALLIYADRTTTSGMIQVPEDTRLADACGFDEVHLFLPPVQVLQLA